MSFETARTVTSASSFADSFAYSRRQPDHEQPRGEIRQTVNISQNTLAKAATKTVVFGWSPKLSYNQSGNLSKGRPVGSYLNVAV